MKKIALGLVVVLSASSVFAKEYRCEAESSNSRNSAHFDSTQPFLENIVYILETDGSLKWVFREDIFNPKKVCDVNVDFAADCKVTADEDLGSGYAFAFECAQKQVRGEFVVDSAGGGTLKCNDDAPTHFENCVAQ